MSEELEGLQRLLAEAKENLQLIDERSAQYVLSTDVPLQLIKEQRRLQKTVRKLERQIRARKPIEVLRQAVKLLTGPVTIIAHGAPDSDLRRHLLDQASRLPHGSYLDVALLEQSVDELVRLIREVQVLLQAYRYEPGEGTSDALKNHAAPLVDPVRRIFRLTTEETPALPPPQ
jgi:hypothetical protein